MSYDWRASTIRIHDVFRAYLREHQVHGLTELHWRFLERNCPESGNWAQLPRAEKYLWRHLADHLVGADRRDALRELLFDFGYLAAKLTAAGVNALLGDYDVLGEGGPARTVQGALRLSAHVVAKDASQLAGQPLGRLERREPRRDALLGDTERYAPLAGR